MTAVEINRYTRLNELAEQGGIVIFGGSEAKNIPIGELRQAFAVEANMYNRSIDGLSVTEAAEMYGCCAAPLVPETVLLHIGDADTEFFAGDPDVFDKKYRELIAYIRSGNKKCRIAVVSLRNYDENPQIAEMNLHLKYIAESEQCEYGDIAGKRVWNPQGTRDAVSFVYSMGFVHPLKNKRPVYELVRMLFCCEQ